MGENSKIEWTDHTWNPWRGCAKVHAGCANCYAETMFSKRLHDVEWGTHGTRKVASEAAWREPSKWNRDAEKRGVRERVFCASLADVFEDWVEPIRNATGDQMFDDRNGGWSDKSGDKVGGRLFATMGDVRARLFALIDATPNLDWLLLTKRPENIRRMWPCKRDTDGDGDCAMCHRGDSPCRHRSSVWLGTSISDQPTADAMIPELLKCRDLCAGLFVSAEPLLGPVDLRANAEWLWSSRLKWVIAGGESGPNARPMHPDWARGLRDQCQAAGVPFFFKQWGEFAPAGATGEHCFNPGASIHELVTMRRVGKKLAGATLDGREWRETPFPEANPCET